jgi:hypothetical protein
MWEKWCGWVTFSGLSCMRMVAIRRFSKARSHAFNAMFAWMRFPVSESVSLLFILIKFPTPSAT